MSAFVSLRSSSCYWPTLNHLAKGLRSPMLAAANNATLRNVPSSASEQKLGAFGSANPFVLPGDVAIALPATGFNNNTSASSIQSNPLDSFAEASAEKHDLASQVAAMTGPSAFEVQVSAHECPASIRRDIESLFPNQAMPWPVLALTIAQRTQNDMITWSADVAEEREILTAQLISTATAVCRALQAEGYFADFIDPSSGRPFLSKDYTPATLFETDPIQRHFGVEVKDLGCCKAVAHAIWGTKVFIGTLFTNAPADSPIVKSLLSPRE